MSRHRYLQRGICPIQRHVSKTAGINYALVMLVSFDHKA